MATYKPERAPKPAFKDIKQLNRYKRLLLGLPIERVKYEVRWGYDKDTTNPDLYIPDERALRLLLKAREYLRTCSLQEVARWLSDETKRPLSYEGLRLILRDRYPFQEIMLSQNERERIYREVL